MILDADYDRIVMDGIPTDLYSSVPSSAQRTLMLYDEHLRMIWNGEHKFHLIVRRTDLRDPIRVADKVMVGWWPILTVEHGVDGMEATLRNLRLMDKWKDHGRDPEAAAKALEQKTKEREAKIAAEKAAEDAAHAGEFTDWCDGQKVYSTGGDPGKTDATLPGYRIIPGVTKEQLDG